MALGGSEGGEGAPGEGAEPQYLPHATKGLCLRLEWSGPCGSPSGRKPFRGRTSGPVSPDSCYGPWGFGLASTPPA